MSVEALWVEGYRFLESSGGDLKAAQPPKSKACRATAIEPGIFDVTVQTNRVVLTKIPGRLLGVRAVVNVVPLRTVGKLPPSPRTTQESDNPAHVNDTFGDPGQVTCQSAGYLVPLFGAIVGRLAQAWASDDGAEDKARCRSLVNQRELSRATRKEV